MVEAKRYDRYDLEDVVDSGVGIKWGIKLDEKNNLKMNDIYEMPDIWNPGTYRVVKILYNLSPVEVNAYFCLDMDRNIKVKLHIHDILLYGKNITNSYCKK